ncbi:MAG: 5'/3'-nucleotidase SurE [Gammaproteobacteria bacterium]|nr:5'/3'-nucleotidase SurE [Gammaproteobacteria bacterium]
MKILLSNDDGYQAPGLMALYKVVSKFADVVVMAPEDNRSGASNSLTLRKPLTVNYASNGFGYVNGTPADCVHLAINGVLDFLPDMVISGINHGANLGDDVLYSGTVAAAIEGRFLGLPAIAISLAGSKEPFFYNTASAVVNDLLVHLMDNPLPSDNILNINIPNIPLEKVKGMEPARLGSRHQSQPIIRIDSDQDGKMYQIGPPGNEADAGLGTDFFVINQNKVSITPLQIDMTRHHDLGKISDWLSAR